MASDTIEMSGDEFIKSVPEVLHDAPISPQLGLAAIALNFALKYCDINTVQDGVLYQQYKMEGRNMHSLHLAEVFDVAAQIEQHLLNTPSRLAGVVLDMVATDIEQAIDGAASEQGDETQPTGPAQ